MATERTAAKRIAWAWAWTLVLVGSLLANAPAQSVADDAPGRRDLGSPTATLRLGVAGIPVASRWNPLVVEVRNVRLATVTVTFDDPEATTPPTFEGVIDAGGGVGVLDVDLPVPNVSRIVWRIESEGGVLASGAYGPRDVRSDRLDLLLSTDPRAATRTSWADENDVRIAVADLPRRASSFDAIARLVVDGSTAVPEAEVLVTAAASGVTVVLPDDLGGAFASLRPLLRFDGSPVGAGSIVRASSAADPRPVPPVLEVMPTDLDVNGALSRPTWPHRTRAAVVAAAGLHLAVTTLLLQLGGSSARTAGVVWMLLASGAGAAWFAVDGTARSSTASLAVSGSQIARRVTWTTITDPHGGTVRRSGIVRPESGVTAVRWTPEGTEIDVARATTLTVASAPEIVFVPGDLRPVDEAAASLPPGWRRLPTPAAWPSGPTDGDRGDWRTDGSTIVVVREEGVP